MATRLNQNFLPSKPSPVMFPLLHLYHHFLTAPALHVIFQWYWSFCTPLPHHTVSDFIVFVHPIPLVSSRPPSVFDGSVWRLTLRYPSDPAERPLSGIFPLTSRLSWPTMLSFQVPSKHPPLQTQHTRSWVPQKQGLHLCHLCAVLACEGCRVGGASLVNGFFHVSTVWKLLGQKMWWYELSIKMCVFKWSIVNQRTEKFSHYDFYPTFIDNWNFIIIPISYAL